MTHAELWRALDVLAAERGLSPSGLAREAGLDPTAFNPSKRRGRDGHERWPSTESLARVLAATGTSLERFAALVASTAAPPPSASLPLLEVTSPLLSAHFDADGLPAGEGWTETPLASRDDPEAYALRIRGDRHAPILRDRALVVISPGSPVRPDDRAILAERKPGTVTFVEILERDSARVAFRALQRDCVRREEPVEAIAWMHRLLWASQ
jgi:phage repressor protein C with HTH and peptisase S24 domain